VNVKVLGPGCARCKQLFIEVEKAVAQAGVSATVEKIEKLADMLDMGITVPPAIVIDNEVKCSGRVPSVPEIVGWLNSEKNRIANARPAP